MAGLPLIVFDVNETLLDLESLTPTFERIFGERLFSPMVCRADTSFRSAYLPAPIFLSPI